MSAFVTISYVFSFLPIQSYQVIQCEQAIKMVIKDKQYLASFVYVSGSCIAFRLAYIPW